MYILVNNNVQLGVLLSHKICSKTSRMLPFFQFYSVIIFSVFTLLIGVLLSLLTFSVSNKCTFYAKKISSYECGFEPFSITKTTFNVQYYVVAILFIIFDVEIAFMLPWSLCTSHTGLFGFWIMTLFLLIITLGFVYEWVQGGFGWS